MTVDELMADPEIGEMVGEMVEEIVWLADLLEGEYGDADLCLFEGG